MNIGFWISSGFFILVTAAFFIFCKLNMDKYKRIFLYLLTPVLAAVTITSLMNFTPDSKHIIFISAASLLFCSISVIFLSFNSRKAFKIIGRSTFLLSVFHWFLLYRSTFYIFKTPVFLTIICAIIYLAAIILTCIFSEQKTFNHYLWTVFAILICSIFHFSTTVTLFFAHNIYSIFLFAGATGVTVLSILYLFAEKKQNDGNSQDIKKPDNISKLFQFCLLFGSQLCITAANFLMLN